MICFLHKVTAFMSISDASKRKTVGELAEVVAAEM